MAHTERVQIVLPKNIAEELRAVIPARRRSAFIAEAIAHQLMVRDREQVIDEAFGAWTDENHPYLNTADDIRVWREALWAGEDREEALRVRYENLRKRRKPRSA